jgi:hypothetical protein
MPTENWVADGDLLIGATALCDFINTLVDSDCRVTPAVVYAWIERGHIPTKRIGSRIIGSKSAIRKALFP